MKQPQLEPAQSAFPPTDWSLLAGLRSSDAATQEQSANSLINTYWPPVFAWMRRNGLDHHRAAELTQEFFVDVVLGRRLFEHAQRERGRLRDLIKAALANYRRDVHRRRSTRQASLTISAGDLLGECVFIEDAREDSPERSFDRRWAVAILERAMSECQKYYEESDNLAYWNAFDLWILQPLIFGSRPVPRAEIARLFDFSDESHVSVAIRLVKLRLRRIIKQIVMQTLDDPADVADELNHLELLF